MNIINDTSACIDKENLLSIKKYLTTKEIELLIVENDKIKELNKKFRNIDKPTDVLSFPMEIMGDFNTPLGSIVINIDYVKQASSKYKHTFDNEMSLLFIHGLLHLLGYDHEIDNGQMRAKEEEVINYFSLPESLIIRTKN